MTDGSIVMNWSDVEWTTNDLTHAFLGVAGSQIFIMQLGFLCYEVGFVNPVWTSSIIVKNMQDTFVGIMTYLCFTYSFAYSEHSFFGIIGAPDHLFLHKTDRSLYGRLFLSACFATTCATVISGAVLQRLKNKGYITWCFLTVLVNYSFVSHWVWNKQGWLNKMGFMDCAGGLVVHSTGGLAGVIANYFLGPQRGSVDPKTHKLKRAKVAQRPVLLALGCFLLWYGWFSFNLTSPFVAGVDIDGKFGAIALAIIVVPAAASFSSLFIMKFWFHRIVIEDLITCTLAALVAASGCCYTVQYLWSAFAIGIFASPVFFLSNHLIRNKLVIDDPLAVGSTHFFPGLYGILMEGVFANANGDNGLFYGGWKHFFVQVLGICIVTAANIACSMALWKLMVNVIWRSANLRVTALDTYIGTKLFHLKPTLAFNEMLSLQSNVGKQVLLHFHKFCVDRLCDEELDFLMAVTIFKEIDRYLPELAQKESGNVDKVFRDATKSIIETYVLHTAPKCINVSTPARAMPIRMYDDLKMNVALVDKTIFDTSYREVYKVMMEPLRRFLTGFHKSKHTVRWKIRVPFQVNRKWDLVWDDDYEKTKTRSRSAGSSLAFDDEIVYHADEASEQAAATRKDAKRNGKKGRRHGRYGSGNNGPSRRKSSNATKSTTSKVDASQSNTNAGLLKVRSPSLTPGRMGNAAALTDGKSVESGHYSGFESSPEPKYTTPEPPKQKNPVLGLLHMTSAASSIGDIELARNDTTKSIASLASEPSAKDSVTINTETKTQTGTK